MLINFGAQGRYCLIQCLTVNSCLISINSPTYCLMSLNMISTVYVYTISITSVKYKSITLFRWLT